MPIFTLVTARAEGRLDRQLNRSDFDCAAYLAGPHPPPEPGQTPQCGARINLGLLSAKAITMSRLAASLAPLVSRSVVDKTALTGAFDIELTWTPEPATLDAAPNPPGTSIFAALQEQLGLRLATGRGPVDVWIVDHLLEPSEN